MTLARIGLAITLTLSPVVYAQPEGDAAGAPGGANERPLYGGIHVGRMLPFGIYGVRSIYPYWGGRFGHPFGDLDLEWSFFSAVGNGVKFHTASLSLAFWQEFEGIDYITYIGLDLHYYSGHTNVQTLPYSTSAGGHVGVSPLIKFGKAGAFRVDFKMDFNPGRALYVGAGPQINF
ncbi:MAG: hypothetical protein AB7F86_14640 [Bdellovibrionales bacterium]